MLTQHNQIINTKKQVTHQLLQTQSIVSLFFVVPICPFTRYTKKISKQHSILYEEKKHMYCIPSSNYVRKILSIFRVAQFMKTFSSFLLNKRVLPLFYKY